MLIDDRDKAFSKGHMRKYHRLRTAVIDHVKRLKCSYLKNAMSKKDSRSAWKAIRTVSRMKSGESVLPKYFTADEFNAFFSSVFQSKHPVGSPPSSLPDVRLELSVCEVQVALSKLQRKSCAPGDVPYWVYRDFSHCLSPAVASLFNRSLKEGCVPPCLKKAVITPIPKCNKPSALSDFRPISMLPLLSKVFEKLFASRWILPFIRDKVNDTQYAYLPGPGSGTICALTLTYNRIVNFLDRSGAVRVISIDFSKAFDKVARKEIIDASIRFQIPLLAANWIVSFLSDRLQYIHIGENFSS
ncbi:MAG: reverse transcriptase domain-containing protein, partial [Pseudomonadota bacterium]